MNILSVSVVVPVYNGSRYLDEQLQSIVSQLSIFDELIIINDASTDSSHEIIQSYTKYQNVKYFENESNSRLTANINKGLKIASGDIIVLADQDDVWLPHRVSTIRVEHLVADCVVVDAFVCDENLEIIRGSYFNFIDFTLNPIRMLARCRVLGCCMSFRRSSVIDVKIPAGCWHDHFLILFFMLRGLKISVVDVPLIQYRRHQYALSNAGKPKTLKFKFFRVFYSRMYLIISILLTFLFQKLVEDKIK